MEDSPFRTRQPAHSVNDQILLEEEILQEIQASSENDLNRLNEILDRENKELEDLEESDKNLANNLPERLTEPVNDQFLLEEEILQEIQASSENQSNPILAGENQELVVEKEIINLVSPENSPCHEAGEYG